jgi:hypothetical protein
MLGSESLMIIMRSSSSFLTVLELQYIQNAI